MSAEILGEYWRLEFISWLTGRANVMTIGVGGGPCPGAARLVGAGYPAMSVVPKDIMSRGCM